MKKKYIIGIIIVAVILIGTGALLKIRNSNSNENGETSLDFAKPIFTNEITGRRCVSNICIDTLSIEYLDDNSGILEFMLINTDLVNAQIGGHFVLTPDTSDPLNAYFDEIPAGEMVYVKVSFSDKNVTKMKDYVLSDLVADGNEEF